MHNSKIVAVSPKGVQIHVFAQHVERKGDSSYEIKNHSGGKIVAWIPASWTVVVYPEEAKVFMTGDYEIQGE